jgi:hypothetical protein
MNSTDKENDVFKIHYVSRSKSNHQAIIMFIEYIRKHIGKDIKIEIVDCQEIKTLKSELETARELVKKSNPNTDIIDDYEWHDIAKEFLKKESE